MSAHTALWWRIVSLMALLMGLMCFGIAAWRPGVIILGFGMVAWSVASLHEDEEEAPDADGALSD